MNKMFCIGLLVLLFAATGFAQVVSEKTDVSVFDLSYYSYKVPNNALANIDSTIRSVFVDMGRFKVIQVAKSFDDPNDLATFIEQVKKIKEKKVQIPDAVSYGRATFSEDDFNNLISSFIVIVPELLSFSSKEKYDKKNNFAGYEVNFKTSFSVIDASTMEVVAKPTIESNGTDKDDRGQALESAIRSMTGSLTFELKKVPIFTIKTGVVEAKGGKITFKKGKNMGILPGFEFELIRTDILSSGDKKEYSDGLVIVSDVYEEVSDALVLYGDAKEGDQLKEVPRAGGELALYYHGIYDLDSQSVLSLIGIKATVTLGFFSFRPLIGIELPLFDVYGIGSFIFAVGVPMNAYIGADFPIYMGRLQITPTITLKVGGIYFYTAPDPGNNGDTQQFFATHIGGTAYANISYLVTRDMKLYVDLGYTYMASGLSTILTSVMSYNGPTIGIGIDGKI
jgi:hypothetical protein